MICLIPNYFVFYNLRSRHSCPEMSASLGEDRSPVSQLDLLKKKKKTVLVSFDDHRSPNLNHGIAVFDTLKYDNLKLSCKKFIKSNLLPSRLFIFRCTNYMILFHFFTQVYICVNFNSTIC